MPRTGFFPIKAALSGAAFLLLLCACASPDSFGGSRQGAERWATMRGFSAKTLAAGSFALTAFTRHSAISSTTTAPTAEDTLVVYIEGDGAAWPTPFDPPRDPTPEKPLALALAAADATAHVAYLGRPCQYLAPNELAGCPPTYWIERRFAAEVVAAYDMALTQLKAQSGAKRLHPVGYSGGGVIAALLAHHREDVERLITIAAPLALADWLALHHLSPLTGSLDPMDLPVAPDEPRGKRKEIHFVGSADRIVPPALLTRYVARHGGRIESIAGFDHERYWSRDWPQLVRRARNEEKTP